MDSKDIIGQELGLGKIKTLYRMTNNSSKYILRRGVGKRYLLAGPNAYNPPARISAKGPPGTIWNSRQGRWVNEEPINNNPYSVVSTLNTVNSLVLSPNSKSRKSRKTKSRKTKSRKTKSRKSRSI